MGRFRNGLHGDPPIQSPLFPSDPYQTPGIVPPLYTYPPIFESDPTGTPPPPGGYPTLPVGQLKTAPPTPATAYPSVFGGMSGSTLLLLGGGVLLLLMMKKR